VAEDEAARHGLTRSARGVSLLVPLLGEMVAPRFDLATEVLIARARKGRLTGEPRVVLLPGPSADALCSLVLEEAITDVVCGGIEDAHYQYLAWKKVRVVDRVIGAWEGVLRLFLANELRPGTVVRAARGAPGASGATPPRR
jgi:hypothetical protein